MERLAKEIIDIKFITITAYGATDNSVKEEESISIRACNEGKIQYMLVSIIIPMKLDGEDVTKAI